MKIAMVSTPYLSVPPKAYGGTELVVGLLTEELVRRGHNVTLYATGDSRTSAQLKSIFPKSIWPPKELIPNPVAEVQHCAWAVKDAIDNDAEVIHMHCSLGLAMQQFSSIPHIYTIHHPFDQELFQYYLSQPRTNFIAISDFQRKMHHGLRNMQTIHHGLDLTRYQFQAHKGDYLLYLGRIAAVKGVHLAIKAAQQAGINLKIAGDIQPLHREYFDTFVKPKLDGRTIEYVGEADHRMKVELLKNARAMLFPIQWQEPFGLVMIESMACGTPVIAFPQGSVPEVVKDGLSGFIVAHVAQIAAKVKELDNLSPHAIRDYAERYFSVQRMADQYETAYLNTSYQYKKLRAFMQTA
jgi:glycosyltransferase involved in cell wall biosynthesis